MTTTPQYLQPSQSAPHAGFFHIDSDPAAARHHRLTGQSEALEGLLDRARTQVGRPGDYLVWPLLAMAREVYGLQLEELGRLLGVGPATGAGNGESTAPRTARDAWAQAAPLLVGYFPAEEERETGQVVSDVLELCSAVLDAPVGREQDLHLDRGAVMRLVDRAYRLLDGSVAGVHEQQVTVAEIAAEFDDRNE